MKRKLCVFLTVIFCAVAFLPGVSYAETYLLSGTDMSISIDDTLWYVFTRDNIQNNPELEELGIAYDTMYDILYDNEAYMDAILFYEDGEYVELFVRKRPLDSGIANLSNYENEEVLELAKELAKKQGAEEHSVYESQYKFAKTEYIDSNFGYYICEYVTVVNKDNYTLTFQTTSPFTSWEHDEIETIVDSIAFDIDTTLKEKRSASIFDGVIEKTVGGAVVGGIVGAVIAIANKSKKKKGSKSDESCSVKTM